MAHALLTDLAEISRLYLIVFHGSLRLLLSVLLEHATPVLLLTDGLLSTIHVRRQKYYRRATRSRARIPTAQSASAYVPATMGFLWESFEHLLNARACGVSHIVDAPLFHEFISNS